MIRKITLLWIFLFAIKQTSAQNFLIESPQQLAVGSSTARVASWLYAGSALAQSFYSHQSRLSMSLYIPYVQLTDGKVRTSTLQYYSPSFKWGALHMGYADYSVSNFDKQIMSVSSYQIGYANQLFDRLVIASKLKWQKESWYSDLQESVSLAGTALDISGIYIIDGYSSLGFSLTNALRTAYSSIKNDAPSREIRLGYSWLDRSTAFSLEGGLLSAEDAFFETNWGGYVNSEFYLPMGFRLAAEYRKLFHNEIGAVLSFSYITNNFNAELSYAIRVDDSPLPISTLQQSWGIHISLNQIVSEKATINPQILLRDESAPHIKVKRISEYAVFKKDDESDILKFETQLRDAESGLNSVVFNITHEKDTTHIIYSRNYKISGNTLIDTVSFDGYANNDEFLENGHYLGRIVVSDIVGNEKLSNTIPFRVLSKRNDNQGPEISISFNNSELVLEESEIRTVLSTEISIEDKESNWVQWKVQLYKMDNDSLWSGLKTVSGGIEIKNRKFSWLLRNNSNNSIQGQYKIKIAAKDEIGNASFLWSDIKTITQNGTKQQEIEFVKEESSRELSARKRDIGVPEVIYLSEEVSAGPAADSHVNLLKLNASYFYRNKEVKLSDFTFFSGQRFDPYFNQLSLSVLGVYLQDLPLSKLVIEYPIQLIDTPGFESELQNFLDEAYDIESQRIVFMQKPEHSKLIFYIKE